MDHILALWSAHGLPVDFLRHLELTGDADSAVQSSFRLGTAAQVATSLAALSAAYVYYLRTGILQRVTVDARHAALAFHSEAFYTIDKELPSSELWDSIAGLYETMDENYVRIHTNFPHHRRGVLDVLGLQDGPSVARSVVAHALKTWNSFEFEDECAKRGLCVTAMRPYDTWKSHPHAISMQDAPPIVIRKISESPNADVTKLEPTSAPSHPLAGIRVLDLTRVLAGPIAGRSLAAHGASVLLVTSPPLPSLPTLDVETSIGKRTTQLDLTNTNDHETLTNLAHEADVFLQAYRPGGLAEKGFGPDRLVALRGGKSVVCANLTAWGWDGPWKDRRGFDSLVQTATGFNVDEAESYAQFGGDETIRPRPFPFQALDHAAGHFLTFGINVALAKALLDGGSYEVRVSLLSTGNWIRSLGRLSPSRAWGLATPFPSAMASLAEDSEVGKLSIEWRQRHSTEEQKHVMRCLRYPGILEKTPVREGVGEGRGYPSNWGAPMKLDADEPKWEDLSSYRRRRQIR